MAKSTTGKSTRGTKPATAQPRKGGAFQLSNEPVVRGKEELDVHKYEVTIGEEAAPAQQPSQEPAFEQLGELPQSYGATTLYLVARDPHWLFSYWDVDWSAYPSLEVKDGRFYLKLFTEEGGEEFTTEINPDAKNWYVPVSKPGANYYAELGYNSPEGAWQSIARSQNALAPADVMSDDAQATFATVPLHLTFERLVEMVRAKMREGETLLQVLARLQSENRGLAPGSVPGFTEEQRMILEALFGKELVDRISMSSGEINELLRQELQQKLSTESASEIVAKARALAGGESSLFSGVGAFGSGELSSGLLSSGAFSSGLFSAALLSGLGAWGSEVTSWLAGFGALGAFGSGSAFSSGFAGAGAFGSEVTSWGGLGSLGAFGSEVTSWSNALGSSWSAQPFSEEKGREFFMHVNAEVIFYGGTHPDAKVTIAGQEVKLNPDGSFRYHFRFPDANHEIPIVAQSPDGIEERSATLTLKRATARKGDVGHTAQPEHLGTPMGQKS